MKTICSALFIACSTFSTLGNAATMVPAMLAGQVQQFTDSGAVSGCGVTLVGFELNVPKQALVFNGSVVIYKSGLTLVKGRGSEVDSKQFVSQDFDVRNMKALKTQTFWLRANGSRATTISEGTKVIESEDKGYRLYATPFEPAFNFIESVLTGEQVQIGLQLEGRKLEQVLFGTVKLSDQEKAQLGVCLSELTGK